MTTKIYGVLLIAAIVIMIGLGGWIALLKYDIAKQETHISQLKADVAQLESNNATLKGNLTVAEDANKTNQSTINSLIAERKQGQDAIQLLSEKHKANLAYTATLQARIAELAKDPKNDGIVSPVLAEAIKTIEARRGAK